MYEGTATFAYAFADAQTGFIRYVLKFAIPQIAVKRIAAITRNVDVLPTIIVKVGDRNAHTPTLVC